jgi:hypothetical protein
MTLKNRAATIAGGISVLFLVGTLAHRQLNSTNLLRSPVRSLGSELDGTIDRPFAYRVLVPTLLHVIDLFPASVVDTAEAKLRPLASFNLPADAALETRPIYTHALFAVLILALLAYALFTSATYRLLFDVPAWFRPFPPVIALLAVIPFMRTHGAAHTYDFPALACWAGLAYALVTERQRLFLAVLVLGCLNKETMILAVLPWALVFRDRLPARRLRAWMFAQLVLVGLAQGVVHFLRRNNPGAHMERYLMWHVGWFIERSFVDFAAALVIGALIVRRFRDRPVVLRRAAVLMLPLVVLYVAGGYPGEFRVFFDALPLCVVLATRNVQTFLTDAFVPAETEVPPPRDRESPTRSGPRSGLAAG